MSRSASVNPRRGIVLILVMGVLTLLSFSGVALAKLATQLRTSAGVQADAASARLLARSGLEYASARLYQDSIAPVLPTQANQADDWTYRDGPGVALERSLNPSYAQTETYTDIDGNGKYEPAGDALLGGSDWNANGCFDSWSGRLRSMHGLTGGTFVLDVSGRNADGGLNVNSGMMDDTDIGFAAGKTAEIQGETYRLSSDTYGNGVPDYRDLGIQTQQFTGTRFTPPVIPLGFQWNAYEHQARNRKLAGTIDKLALYLGVAAQSPGEQIVGNRPLGGYSSLDQVKSLCGFLPTDWDLLRPHLTVFSRRNPAAYYPVKPDIAATHIRADDIHYFINATTASPDLLAALFSGMQMGPFGGLSSLGTVLPSEARQVGSFLKEYTARFRSWYDLYLELQANRERLFISTFIPRTSPVGLEDCRLGKAALVHALASPEEMGLYDTVGASPFRRWAYYDENQVRMHKYWAGYCLGFGTNPLFPSYAGSAAELGFGLPSRFSIRSLGRVASGRETQARSEGAGLFTADGKIDALTQADFENFWFTRARDGFPKKLVTTKRFEAGAIEGRPARDRAATYPCFSRDACLDLADDPLLSWTHGDNLLPSDQHFNFNYCPFFGEVMLADRSWVDAGPDLVFYQPNWDLDQPERPRPGAGFTFDMNFDDAAGGARWKRLQDGTSSEEPIDAVLINVPPSDLLKARGQVLGTGSTNRFFVVPAFPVQQMLFHWNPFGGNDKNEREFPLVVEGCLSQGTVETWFPKSSRDSWIALYGEVCINFGIGFWWERNGSYEEIWTDSGSSDSESEYVLPSYAFEASGATAYVNGIAHGMFDYSPMAVNPGTDRSYYQNVPSGVCIGDETRFYRRPLPAESIAVHALKGRFWTPDLSPIPSFTSPLYRFDSPTKLTDVAWDGFVPKPLKDAAEENGAVPLRVELLLEIGGSWISVPLPADSWKTGGIRQDFKSLWQAIRPGQIPPAVSAMRYRVWLDASALGLADVTPVFDGISIGFKSARLRFIQ